MSSLTHDALDIVTSLPAMQYQYPPEARNHSEANLSNIAESSHLQELSIFRMIIIMSRFAAPYTFCNHLSSIGGECPVTRSSFVAFPTAEAV